MRRHHVCAAVAIALAVSGCAIQRSRVVSPYQKALGAYYRALETQALSDLSVAEQEATAVLSKDPSDHTARTLRAQMSLTRLRLSGSLAGPPRRALLTDLMTVSAGVGTSGDTADWVPARALVVMADLLVLDGDALMAAALASGKVDEVRVAEAKSLFDGARQLYSGAAAISDQRKADATPGLVREGANARQGHVVALRGAINALDTLDPALEFVMTSAVRNELVRAWETQSAAGTVPAASASVLTMDPAQHGAMQALYITLGNTAQKQLATWCGQSKATLPKPVASLTAAEQKSFAEGAALLRRVLGMSEFEAIHASLARVLRGSGDVTSAAIKVVLWFKQDLSKACSLFP